MASTPAHASAKDVRPPQFGLRTLLIGVAICSAICAVFVAVGAIWGSLLLFFAALVAAHVAGNALGTRLRDQAGRSTHANEGPLPVDVPRPQRRIEAAPSPLSRHWSLGRTRFLIAVLGAVGGARVGRLVFIYGAWLPMRPGDLVVGVGSCAVLGALAGFLATSIVQVALWPAVTFFFRRRERDRNRPG